MKKSREQKLVIVAILTLVIKFGFSDIASSGVLSLPNPTLDELNSSNPPKNSAYSYSDGTSEDYNIKFSDGTSTVYKKFELKSSEIGSNYFTLSNSQETSPTNYTWADANQAGSNIIFDNNTNPQSISGAIRTNVFNNSTYPASWNSYNSYTYNVPTGYNVTNTLINNTISTDGANVQNKVFSGISNSNNGAAVKNYNKDLSSVNIIADFIGNQTSTNGGSFYNEANGAGINSKINSIIGDFVGNHASTSGWGGAIANTGEIGTIIGDFINNNTAGNGGAIDNSKTIGSIYGDFIGNVSSFDHDAGLWNNTNKVVNVFADTQNVVFYGNKNNAVYQKDEAGNVTGFTSNSYTDVWNLGTISFNAASDKIVFLGGGIGGATSGVIELNKGKYDTETDSYDLSSTGEKYVFNNNVKTVGINLYNGAYLKLGGVQQIIEDKRSADNLANIDWVQSIFDSERNAIGDFKPLGDSNTTYGLLNIKGLTTDDNENKSTLDTKNNHIEANNLGILNLNSDLALKIDLEVSDTNSKADTFAISSSPSNGKIILDTIDFSEYVRNLSEGNSDTLKNAVFNAVSGTIDVKDNIFTNYNIGKLTSSNNVKYNIDLSWDNGILKSDSFTVGANSTGKINLGSLSIENNLPNDTEQIVQIIHATGNNAPQHAYNDSKVLTEATAVMTSDTILAKGFGLFTTNTTNDSIKIRGLQDSFKAWTNLETDEHKEFTFENDSSYNIANTINFNEKNNAEIVNNGTVTNDGILSNFSLINNGNFTTNAENVSPTGQTITNNGNLTFTGGNNTNNINKTSGTNSKVIFSGVSTNNGSITQDNVEIQNTSTVTNNALITAKLTNNGNLISSASNLNGEITNDGILDLTGGINNNVIKNTSSSKGTVNLKGVTQNNKNITAKKINNSGSNFVNKSGAILTGSIENIGNMTVNANDLHDKDNSILNDGTLTLKDGANSNDITTTNSASVVNFENISSNTKNVTANRVNNSGDSVLSNTGNIQATSFSNNGIWTNSDTGKIKATNITNSGTLTSSADKLDGAITNNNILNLSGVLANKTISGSGTTKVDETLVLNENANISGILDLNDGNVIISSGNITNHNIGALEGNGNISLDISYSG